MTMFRKFVLTALLGASLTAAALGPGVATAAPVPAPAAACTARVWLTPKEIPGPLWQEHRHWLESPIPYNGSRYVIVNMRTYGAYQWAFWGNFDGRARFGVSTWWALGNPGWKADPWLLL